MFISQVELAAGEVKLSPIELWNGKRLQTQVRMVLSHGGGRGSRGAR